MVRLTMIALSNCESLGESSHCSNRNAVKVPPIVRQSAQMVGIVIIRWSDIHRIFLNCGQNCNRRSIFGTLDSLCSLRYYYFWHENGISLLLDQKCPIKNIMYRELKSKIKCRRYLVEFTCNTQSWQCCQLCIHLIYLHSNILDKG